MDFPSQKDLLGDPPALIFEVQPWQLRRIGKGCDLDVSKMFSAAEKSPTSGAPGVSERRVTENPAFVDHLFEGIPQVFHIHKFARAL